MNTFIRCEYCEYEITVEELFQDTDITSIDEHWYCSKLCYDKDWENDLQEDDEW